MKANYSRLTLWETFRCKLAVWLDKQKDRIDYLCNWVEPPSEVWDKIDYND